MITYVELIRKTNLGKDTSFHGYEPQCVLIFQPKKARRKELSAVDGWLNEIISSAARVIFRPMVTLTTISDNVERMNNEICNAGLGWLGRS